MKDVVLEWTEKELEKLEKQIEKEYKIALNETKKKLDDVLSKIPTLDKEKDPLAYYKELNKYNRLTKLINQLTTDIMNVNKVAVKMLNKELLNIYYENFNYGVYVAEHLTGVASGLYIGYDEYVIKDILQGNSNPFEQIAIEEYLDKKQVQQQIKSQFTQALIQGESIQNIAKRIQNVIARNLFQAVRIARTETTRIQNSARLDSFKKAEEKGLKLKKVWSSTLDKRTRSSHRKLDGDVVELDGKFKNGLRYPGDYLGSAKEVINCRCSLLTEFVGFEKTELEKKLDENLKKIKYEEWKELRK